ncbi:MAG TPA: isochorismatase family cysteine hydrolase [Longimicrobiales bacterium]
MDALLVVDAQNEFSANGQRPVPNHTEALHAIVARVAQARAAGWPIAWIRHHNRPDETPAFVPGSWGAELSPELDPRLDVEAERLFEKDVYGAFTGTDLESWLRQGGVTRVLVVGFYTHMCVSTTVREALVRGLEVRVDPDATGACDLTYAGIGHQTADEVRRSALLHLTNMGASLHTTPTARQVSATTERAFGGGKELSNV